jgi:hypothetical protein
MNGIWIRSESGRCLVHVNYLWIEPGDERNYYLSTVDLDERGGKDYLRLAKYETAEAAMRQLDDIQRSLVAFQRDIPIIYDLRERKVKEGDQ